MKTRKVEIYVGYTDHTWNTKVIEIPKDTPTMYIEEAAERKTMELFFGDPNIAGTVAFVGIYNSEVNDEEE